MAADAQDTLGSLFGNLYSQFILRDLFAKMVPGGIILVSSLNLITRSAERSLEILSSITFWPWLLILGLCWVLGFLAQETGNQLGILQDSFWVFLRKKEEGKVVDYYKTNIETEIEADPNYKRSLERVVVIKEACGNTAIALWYSALAIIIGLFLPVSYRSHPFQSHTFIFSQDKAFVLAFMILAGWVLLRAHKKHVRRQERYKEAYVKYKESKKSLARNDVSKDHET